MVMYYIARAFLRELVRAAIGGGFLALVVLPACLVVTVYVRSCLREWRQ